MSDQSNKRRVAVRRALVCSTLFLTLPYLALAQYTPLRGQSVTIQKTSASPATAGLTRTKISAISTSTLGVTVFGHLYSIDISSAQLTDQNNATVPFSRLSVGDQLNVYGTVDPTDALLIRANTVRALSISGSGGGSTPAIPANQLFVLSSEERALFTPPPDWEVDFGDNYESPPLRNIWEAFNLGRAPVPLDPTAGPRGWYEPRGPGSQNHALLWMGESALAYALRGDVTNYEIAARNCLRLLALDQQEGHQRWEALGYGGFWEGGMASMALAGMYAPQGSSSGPQLLAAARQWWADHVAVMRRLRFSDGQVGLIGARMAGGPGDVDEWGGINAALNLQLLDPQPHETLHPHLRTLLTADGKPGGRVSGIPVRWDRPRHVAERWVVLRAVQSGALPRVPANQPAPHLLMNVYRWTAGGRTYIATPGVLGFRPARWEASWAPGQIVRVEVGDRSAEDTGCGACGRGFPNGHRPTPSLQIPANAQHILGPEVR